MKEENNDVSEVVYLKINEYSKMYSPWNPTQRKPTIGETIHRGNQLRGNHPWERSDRGETWGKPSKEGTDLRETIHKGYRPYVQAIHRGNRIRGNHP